MGSETRVARAEQILSVRNTIRRTCRTALATSLLLLAACSVAEHPSPTVAKTPAALEIAEVVPAGTVGAQTVSNYDSAKPDLHVIGITRYQVESATARIVEQGYALLSGAPYDADHPAPPADHVPCIEFKLVEKDSAAFRAWTAARVGRTMAVLMDRKVVTVGNVNSELPAGGLCDFRAPGTTLAEVEELAARLVMPK